MLCNWLHGHVGNAQKGPLLQHGVSVVVRNGRPESSVSILWAGVTSGRSNLLMMFDEENEKEPRFCWWCISLCREPPSVQMAAWWEIGLKGYARHRNAPSREGFYCDVDEAITISSCWAFVFPIDLNLFVICCVGSFRSTRHPKFLQLHTHGKVSLTVCFFFMWIYGMDRFNKQTNQPTNKQTKTQRLQTFDLYTSSSCHGLAPLRQWVLQSGRVVLSVPAEGATDLALKKGK